MLFYLTVQKRDSGREETMAKTLDQIKSSQINRWKWIKVKDGIELSHLNTLIRERIYQV